MTHRTRWRLILFGTIGGLIFHRCRHQMYAAPGTLQPPRLSAPSRPLERKLRWKWTAVFGLLLIAAMSGFVIFHPPNRTTSASTPISLVIYTEQRIAGIDITVSPRSQGVTLLDVSVEFDTPTEQPIPARAFIEILAPHHDAVFSNCQPACKTEDAYFFRTITGTRTRQSGSLPKGETTELFPQGSTRR